MDRFIFLLAVLFLLFNSIYGASFPHNTRDQNGDDRQLTSDNDKNGYLDDIDANIRWVTRTVNGLVKNATVEELNETISKMKLPSDNHTAYVTKPSLFSSLSSVLFKFENYNYNITEKDIEELLSKQPHLSLMHSNDYPLYCTGFITDNCTATLIGPYHALTSAACVFNRSSNQWKTNLNMLRGRKCDIFQQTLYWESVSVPFEYIYNGRDDYNWAYIQFDPDYKSQVWLSMSYNPQLFDEFTPVALAGYSPSVPDGCPFYTPCLLAKSAHSRRFSNIGCGTNLPFPGGAILADNDLANIPPIIAIAQGHTMQLTDVSKITEDMYWLICHFMKQSGYDPENKEYSDESEMVVLVPKV